MTQPPRIIGSTPRPRQSHKPRIQIFKLIHITAPCKVSRRPSDPLRPLPTSRQWRRQRRCRSNRRLRRFIPRLLQERDQLRSARTPQALPRGLVLSQSLAGLVERHSLRETLLVVVCAGGGGSGERGDALLLGGGGQDDVARHHLHVNGAEVGERAQGVVVCGGEGEVVGVGVGVVFDVCDGGEVLEEAAVRAGHVGAHVLGKVLALIVFPQYIIYIYICQKKDMREGDTNLDKVILRRRRRPLQLLRTRILPLPRLAMLHTQNDIKRLNQRALRITAPRELLPAPVPRAVLVADAPWEPRLLHILAAGQERADLEVEDVWVAALVHAVEQLAEVRDVVGKHCERADDGVGVVLAGGGDGAQHDWDTGGAAGFDGDGDEVEPGLVESSGEGGDGAEVAEEVFALVRVEAVVVPETDGGVGGHGGDLEVVGELEEWGRDGGWEALWGRGMSVK